MISLTKIKASILLCLFPYLAACANREVIRDIDYKYSVAAMRMGEPAAALKDFPKLEKGGFITTVERSWISLWDGSKDQSGLLDQVKSLENRKYISVSREAQYFFFSETEEGYIPGEHEIICLHLISAMYFMQNQQWEEAKVEARLAGYFLQTFFKPDQPHFDDPALRVWLAGIWSALGEWPEAQVDLRKAYELSHDKNILPFLEVQRPPSDLSIGFYGVSPDLQWTEGNAFPKFDNSTAAPLLPIHFSSAPWYERHQLRNSTIRDVVMKSNYMAQYYGTKLNKGAEKTIGYTAGGSIMTAGLFVGTAIAGGGTYLLASSGASGIGDALGLVWAAGFFVGKSMWDYGKSLSSDMSRSADESEKQSFENMKTYRFVRFLPNWISFSNQKTADFVTYLKFAAPKSKTSVQFIQRY
ncbi:hypothetical protein [Bdellovibrio svalbardensis]|uniref:Lipoprotein n=1 Tax=Bdellovibrio svalbardensis TaxID=2972972 RepID=A0ABT6DPH1_9BACT|nr:hypothetical protein [Bdellovibrio svalbardensis]MDG0817038.1 hypothetical protein [Bdellovibrio svalbardensis]